jgi:hypothetical protein
LSATGSAAYIWLKIRKEFFSNTNKKEWSGRHFLLWAGFMLAFFYAQLQSMSFFYAKKYLIFIIFLSY